MKKMLALFTCALLLCMTCAYAEDLGIQVIGGNTTTDTTPVSLDDLQLNTIYPIDGYAIVVPQEFLFVDFFAQFKKDEGDHIYTRTKNCSDNDYYWYQECDSSIVYASASNALYSNDWRYAYANWQESGSGAQFAWFRIDITNTNESIEDMTKNISVKYVYRDEFEFGGWIRLIDYSRILMDYSDGCVTRYGYELNMHPAQIVVHPDNNATIGYMTTGNYVLGCTLPNYVVEDTKAPLRIEIKLGDNELTYHIRK